MASCTAAPGPCAEQRDGRRGRPGGLVSVPYSTSRCRCEPLRLPGGPGLAPAPWTLEDSPEDSPEG